jgi:hypothetical protein
MKGCAKNASLSAVPEDEDDLGLDSDDDQESEDEIQAFSKHLGMDPNQDSVFCCI